MNIPLHIESAAKAAIETIMGEVRGVKAVLISTEDGFEVAARTENTAQISRLSAMASSLAALGSIAGEESNLGACANVSIEAAHGHIIMLQAHNPAMGLIVSVITDKEAVLGQVLYFAKHAAKDLTAA